MICLETTDQTIMIWINVFLPLIYDLEVGIWIIYTLLFYWPYPEGFLTQCPTNRVSLVSERYHRAEISGKNRSNVFKMATSFLNLYLRQKDEVLDKKQCLNIHCNDD